MFVPYERIVGMVISHEDKLASYKSLVNLGNKDKTSEFFIKYGRIAFEVQLSSAVAGLLREITSKVVDGCIVNNDDTCAVTYEQLSLDPCSKMRIDEWIVANNVMNAVD